MYCTLRFKYGIDYLPTTILGARTAVLFELRAKLMTEGKELRESGQKWSLLENYCKTLLTFPRETTFYF